MAASLNDHLAIFESRSDKDDKRLGIPFVAFANSPFLLAYDPVSRQMMAQWRFNSPRLVGQSVQYQTYMDANGALNFSFSARF